MSYADYEIPSNKAKKSKPETASEKWARAMLDSMEYDLTRYKQKIPDIMKTYDTLNLKITPAKPLSDNQLRHVVGSMPSVVEHEPEKEAAAEAAEAAEAAPAGRANKAGRPPLTEEQKAANAAARAARTPAELAEREERKAARAAARAAKLRDAAGAGGDSASTSGESIDGAAVGGGGGGGGGRNADIYETLEVPRGNKAALRTALEDYSKADLKQLSKTRGISLRGAKNKTQILNQMMAFF